MLKDMTVSSRDAPEEVEKVRGIFRTAADFYQVPLEELLKGRSFLLSRQRQVALYLATVHTRCTLTAIGEICGGKGESRISQCVRNVKARLAKGDAHTLRNIWRIEQMLDL